MRNAGSEGVSASVVSIIKAVVLRVACKLAVIMLANLRALFGCLSTSSRCGAGRSICRRFAAAGRGGGAQHRAVRDCVSHVSRAVASRDVRVLALQIMPALITLAWFPGVPDREEERRFVQTMIAVLRRTMFIPAVPLVAALTRT
jgi:hypothetical protein